MATQEQGGVLRPHVGDLGSFDGEGESLIDFGKFLLGTVADVATAKYASESAQPEVHTKLQNGEESNGATIAADDNTGVMDSLPAWAWVLIGVAALALIILLIKLVR